MWSTFWTKVFEAAAAGLIAFSGTCVSGGCGPMSWKIDRGTATGQVKTQWTIIGWRSTFDLFCGPEGQVQANAEGAMGGQTEPQPAAVAETETVTP